ncbi:MAG: DNA polymerase III [Arthrospira sp. PLM2.Bin9]|nr:exonuclease domain-containing protein [Arthrospira sp. PLM2.Bin9]TVU53123.1 MAG: DNA polymerase III [Arthrospira sp. PLM2.Bin9]
MTRDNYHLNTSSFIVLDTEGRDSLTEVALVDNQGAILYHAFVAKNHPEPTFRLHQETLLDIVKQVDNLCHNQVIICHHAEHDQRILKRSFKQVEIPYPNYQFICTCKLAKKQLPNLPDYGLSYLCKTLDLRLNRQRFDDRHAHSASYDAQFTYQLYSYLNSLKSPVMSENIAELYQNTPNPFSSIRVNTPFEYHPDYGDIYSHQFDTLKAVIHEIKQSPNHQSQGAIVLGEPGSGKTHLMMRLAQEVLKTNRLFFIRHPTNAKAVNYHTYTRILESFSEKIPQKKLTQLEQFFAKSFVNILSQTDWVNSDKGKLMIAKLQNDNLSLYERVGKPGTDRYRQNWDAIENKILAWWRAKYGLSTDYSSQVLKGIMRFCRYTEISRKNLVRHWLSGNGDADLSEELNQVGLTPWGEDFNREEFALEAIKTLGQLSLLDEPLILIFDQLESLFDTRHESTLASFGSTVKEILTHVPNSLIILNLFPDRWERFQEQFDGSVIDRVSQSVVTLERPSKAQLHQLLKTLCQLKTETNSPHATVDIGLLFTKQELAEIVNQPSIRAVIKRASDYFRHKVQGVPLPRIIPPRNPIAVEAVQFKQELQAIYKAVGEAIKKFDNLTLSPIEKPLAETDEPELDFVDLPNEQTGEDATEARPTEPEPAIKADYESEKFVDLQLDEYWKNLLNQWEKDYDKPRVISDMDDVGKLMSIVSAFTNRYPMKVEQLSFGKLTIPEHLCIKTGQQTYVLAFLHGSGSAFTARMKNFNRLVLAHKKMRFRLMRDAVEPPIRGDVGLREIQKLDAVNNGEYVIMERSDRIMFECIYQAIIDWENREFPVGITLEDIVDFLSMKLPDYWLIKCLS